MRRRAEQPRTRAALGVAWVVLLGTLIAAALLRVPQATDAVLYLSPALLVLLPLAWRRFPGSERLLRLRARRPRVRRGPRRIAATVRSRARAVRSGRLVGSSLSVRPPPVAVIG